MRWLDSDNAAIRATAALCLIHQANFLLAHQIAALEQQCLGGGSYSYQSITRDLPVYYLTSPVWAQCPQVGSVVE